ncbi:MAG: hypothetical protein IPK85_03400 [Gemmatimonadetes bacterium]|nr:hypothetical protein [Gemmatimonadota bacterium]
MNDRLCAIVRAVRHQTKDFRTRPIMAAMDGPECGFRVYIGDRWSKPARSIKEMVALIREMEAVKA